MALIKTYSDSCGNDYPNSYWRAVQINIAAQARRISLVFFGFKDAESFSAGKRQIADAMKVYEITDGEFLQIAASAPEGSTLHDVLANAAEEYALSKLDTPDADGQMVSFFDGATQV